MGEDIKKTFQKRLFIIYILAALFGIACVLRIVHLSVFSNEFSNCKGANTDEGVVDSNCNCTIIENKIEPIRGEIYDDKGRILVSNYSVFDLVVDGKKLRYKLKDQKREKFYYNDQTEIQYNDTRAVNNLIEELATALYNQFASRYNYSKKYYTDKLNDAIWKGKNVTILKSDRNSQRQRVSSDDTSAILKLPLFCSKKLKVVSFPVYYRRFYPYGELAKRTLGNINIQNMEQTGLEQKFNKELAGQKGTKKFIKMNSIRVPLEGSTEPVDGYNIQTTINLDIQYIAYQCLMDKLLVNYADWGCVVIMETKTGEVKAITNLTRNGTEGNYYYTEQFNYALRHECEPGSTFKLASLLTYLEKTPDDSTKSYYLCGCDIKNQFSNRKFDKCYDSDDAGSLHRKGAPIEIFQRSYNEGTATMVFSVYPKNFKGYVNTLDQFGIIDSLELQLGTIKPPTIRRNARDMNTFYSTCFGAGFKMAPIQTLTYYNAVANNGKMIKPMFVKSITGNDGVVHIYETEVIKEQIASPYTIQRAKKYLNAVVTGPHGTAHRYAEFVPHFAGKTGTRDIWDQNTNTYLKSRNSASFCGFFPYEEPKYTMIVYMYNIAKMSGEAVEVFANIAEKIMNIENYSTIKEFEKPQNTPTPVVNSKKPIPVINQSNVLSNIIGMNVSDAVYELTKFGYISEIEGRGIVKQVTLKGKNIVHLTLGSGS